jgi:hypothetical protein
VEPTPPIFVVADDNCRFPLLFVAGTLKDLDAYFQVHAESTPVPEGGIRVTSRFYDVSGRRWYHEGGGGSEGGLVPVPTEEEEEVSQQYLRDIVARGYADLVRFEFEEQGIGLMAVERAFELQPEDFVRKDLERLAREGIVPNYGDSRHRRWHRARGIPINRSH